MDLWKHIAVDYLKRYRGLETSIEFLKKQIDNIDMQMTDVPPPLKDVTDTGNISWENRYVNGISQKMLYEKKLQENVSEYNNITEVLKSLSDEEQWVLGVAYIERGKYHIEKIMDKCCVEKSRAYELMDKALRSFVMAMFGG